jgi:hypothetical protein
MPSALILFLQVSVLTMYIAEFKELRKQWRKSKKEEADARAAVMTRSSHHPYLQRHDSYPEMEYRLRSHSQGAHAEQFTPPAGSPEDMHEIDMQDVYERRQQRFSGLFPPASRTSSPAYTTIHQPTMSSPHSAMNRISSNNTLLPSYEHTGGTADLDVYASYGVYGTNRPGSGHGSMGSFDGKRRSGLYDDKQSWEISFRRCESLACLFLSDVSSAWRFTISLAVLGARAFHVMHHYFHLYIVDDINYYLTQYIHSFYSGSYAFIFYSFNTSSQETLAQ